MGWRSFLGFREENQSTVKDLRLHYAKTVEEVEELLKEGVNPNTQDANGNTPLHCAAVKGIFEVIEGLLEAKTVQVNQKNHKGRIPLDDAIWYGDSHIIQMLLTNGADPARFNLAENQVCVTPFYRAITSGNMNAVEILLSNGVNPNLTGYYSETPLHYAAQQPDSDILKMLIDKGANPNAKMDMGWTPLQRAARTGKLQNMILLLMYGADIGGPKEQSTLFDQCYKKTKDPSFFKCLMFAGLDVCLLSVTLHEADDQHLREALKETQRKLEGYLKTLGVINCKDISKVLRTLPYGMAALNPNQYKKSHDVSDYDNTRQLRNMLNIKEKELKWIYLIFQTYPKGWMDFYQARLELYQKTLQLPVARESYSKGLVNR